MDALSEAGGSDVLFDKSVGGLSVGKDRRGGDTNHLTLDIVCSGRHGFHGAVVTTRGHGVAGLGQLAAELDTLFISGVAGLAY